MVGLLWGGGLLWEGGLLWGGGLPGGVLLSLLAGAAFLGGVFFDFDGGVFFGVVFNDVGGSSALLGAGFLVEGVLFALQRVNCASEHFLGIFCAILVVSH